MKDGNCLIDEGATYARMFQKRAYSPREVAEIIGDELDRVFTGESNDIELLVHVFRAGPIWDYVCDQSIVISPFSLVKRLSAPFIKEKDKEGWVKYCEGSCFDGR